MKAHNFLITEYKTSDAPELLRLLLKLQDTYFHVNASKKIQELKVERDIRKSYINYIKQINENTDNSWKIYLATITQNRIIGFIIGSVEKDESLIKSPIGKLEDWYIEDEYRGIGIGKKLYNEIEKWFKGKGCGQILSDTWQGNDLSINAHKQLGFFVSGISFGKLLK